jgi:hypothetical protein
VPPHPDRWRWQNIAIFCTFMNSTVEKAFKRVIRHSPQPVAVWHRCSACVVPLLLDACFLVSGSGQNPAREAAVRLNACKPLPFSRFACHHARFCRC